MLWQMPQYVVVTVAEIMFSVTGLEFSFTEAPESMKSVLQACWLLTVTVGNVIVVIVAHSHFFAEQSSEFFLFAGLMIVDMLLFVWLAVRYRYNNGPNGENAKAEEVARSNGHNGGTSSAVVGVSNRAYVEER